METNIAELKKELESWETRAGCWVNTYVRDTFEATIEELKKEIEQLKIKNQQLSNTYKNQVAENK